MPRCFSGEECLTRSLPDTQRISATRLLVPGSNSAAEINCQLPAAALDGTIPAKGGIAMKQLAIFDLDGTLFDTTRVNFLAYQQVLAPRGYYPEFDFFRRECFGHDYGYFGPLLAPGASPEELREIHREKKACYASYLKYAVKNEHLFRLIHLMRSEYHTALVTAGSRANSTDILTRFGEQDSFDLDLTAESVTKAKPDPQGFLKAMEYFNVTPEQTIIFEDSPTGIKAAQASGATLFVVEGFN